MAESCDKRALCPCGCVHCAGEGKIFAPGNLRATFDNPQYEKLVDYYLTQKYTLRYTGGMVGMI